MKTKGEMESAVCERLSAFELDFMGRGPQPASNITAAHARFVDLTLALFTAPRPKASYTSII
jgi:hypothetical protein